MFFAESASIRRLRRALVAWKGNVLNLLIYRPPFTIALDQTDACEDNGDDEDGGNDDDDDTNRGNYR